jgi:hypothetical protein
LDTLKPPIHTSSANLGLLAMALDYRVRYYFAVTPIRQCVASHGADVLDMQGISPSLVTCWHEHIIPTLTDLLERVKPANRKLSEAEEVQLLRLCVVLAYFEQFRRTSAALSHSPLVKLTRHDLADVLNVVEPRWLDDLCAQSWLFYDKHKHLLSRPFVLNPTFEGSRDVGGADGDLIVDGVLIEIKATTVPNVEASKVREWLYQLIGYALLDYTDKYRLRRIGFYFSRQGVWLQWSLSDVLSVTCGASLPTDELRREFQREANGRRAK